MNQSFLKNKSESFLTSSNQNFQRQFLQLESWVKTEQLNLEQINVYPKVYFVKDIINQKSCKGCNYKFKNNKKMCSFCGFGFCKKCIVKQRKHLLSKKFKDICQKCENLRLKSRIFESFQEQMEILQKQKNDHQEIIKSIHKKIQKQEKLIGDEQKKIDEQKNELIEQQIQIKKKEDISLQKQNLMKQKETQIDQQIEIINIDINQKKKLLQDIKTKKLEFEEQTQYLKKDNRQLQRNKKVMINQIQELQNAILKSRNIKMEVKEFKNLDESFTMLNQTKSSIFEEVNFKLPQNAEACACKCKIFQLIQKIQRAKLKMPNKLYRKHPRNYGKDSRRCRVCLNARGVIQKYELIMCRKCFRERATIMGFHKYR